MTDGIYFAITRCHVAIVIINSDQIYLLLLWVERCEQFCLLKFKSVLTKRHKMCAPKHYCTRQTFNQQAHMGKICDTKVCINMLLLGFAAVRFRIYVRSIFITLNHDTLIHISSFYPFKAYKMNACWVNKFSLFFTLFGDTMRKDILKIIHAIVLLIQHILFSKR